MPEIKHNFMKGKMNKDLDERLVPSGGYRDALNIQVSTSEGSDVGTVQNILGNSLIAGQDFIGESAVCVGSIADERNDKLYYFITQKNLLANGEFDGNGEGWDVSTSSGYTGSQWTFSNNQAIGTSGDMGTMVATAPGVVNGNRYTITYDVIVATSGGGLVLANHTTDASTLNSNSGSDNVALFGEEAIGTYTIEWEQGPSTTRQNSIWLYNSNTYDGTIDNLFVSESSRARSLIVEYDSTTNTITPVLVDMTGDVLKFNPDNIITGINIIDDLLFWTDNENEPKKINIQRSKEGTNNNGLVHTQLIVNGVNSGDIEEKHITVIRKSPTKSPSLTTKTHGRTGKIEGDIKQEFHFHPSGNSFSPVVDGDEMWVGINTGGGTGNPGELLNLEVGDILKVYKGHGAPAIDTSTGLRETPIARLLIKEVHNSGSGQKQVSQAQNNFATSYPGDIIALSHEAALRVSVSSYVTHDLASADGKYYFELEQEQVGIFERKFPRFACRYRYEDNEYSSVGPFSEVVFFPGKFEYHPTKAYNKGMINNLKELTLRDFVAADIPADVVGIDLLYKNEFSPSVYVIKSVSRGDKEWDTSHLEYNKYTIKTENVYAQIPSSQLIRPWDNVPKTALAQEITGNRVVYGNYTQGYDMTGSQLSKGGGGVEYKITPVISTTLNERLVAPQNNNPVRSVKSQRTYNVGVVYGDKYGRETPIFTNESAHQFISKPSSAAANAIVASVDTDHPHWAEYYKMYIKETANEYYNLPMGRVYDAKDGNVWISFPSIDRNKIDEDTYLILKKGVGAGNVPDENGDGSGNKAVLDEARYKVVAIENEAPDYIKTEYTLLAEVAKKIAGATLFGGNSHLIGLPAEGPFPGVKSFTISKRWWESIGSDDWDCGMLPLSNDERSGIWDTRRDNDIYVSFSNRYKVDGVGWNQSPTVMSNKYRVTSIEVIDAIPAVSGYSGHDLYRITLAETIPETEAWLTEYFDTGDYYISSYSYGGQLRPHFYKEEVKNKPEFDGRFFVKIIEDEVLTAALKVSEETPENGYVTVGAINNLYHLQDGTGAGQTGQAASKTRSHWESNLGGSGGDRWFIDETAFAGVQPANQNHPKHSVTTNDGSSLCDTTTDTAYAKFNQGDLIDWTNGSGPSVSNYPGAGTEGYHAPYLSVSTNPWGTGAGSGNVKLKGVHAATYDAAELADDSLSGYDSSGTDLYLSLSYSGINPTPNTTNSSIGSTPSGDNFLPRHYRDYYWNAFVGDKNWGVGVSSNPDTFNQSAIVSNLGNGKMFRLQGDTTVYKILGVTKRRLYNYMGKLRWDEASVLKEISPSQWYDGQEYWQTNSEAVDLLHHLGGYYGTPVTWGDANTSSSQSHLVNTINPGSLDAMVRDQNQLLQVGSEPWLWWTGRHYQHWNMTNPLNCRVNYLIKYEVVADTGTATSLADNTRFTPSNMNKTSAERLEFVEEFSTTKENVLTSHPAIFETEPKEDVGLDIYYEASGEKPTNVTSLNIHNLITIGAIMQVGVPGAGVGNEGVFVTGITKVDAYPNSWRIDLSMPHQANYYGYHDYYNQGTEIRFYNDDGSFAVTNLQQVVVPGAGAFYVGANGMIYTREDTGASGTQMSSSIIVVMSKKIGLGWFNCWSFGNGVESNRIGDTYNKPYITNGVKVSTTLLDSYKEEHRKYGLIYSGIYNSTSGVNDLNQFIAAEKITKDINPSYGSIQKLYSRSSADGDLIALCEDRVLKILANKDALYNADGNPQLIANNNVLGQAIPFSGEYGISKNPESFASESYRVYFTDKVRGAVMRLSRDGLTPISDHGMKDWFRDNLKLSTKLIGSYDDRSDEYNITLAGRKTLGEELIVNGNFETDPSDTWFQSGSGDHWTWDSVNNNMFSDADDHARVGQDLSGSIALGKTYQISYTVGKPQDGSDLDGRLWVTLHDENANYASLQGTTSSLASVGMHTKNITVKSSWVPWPWGTLANHPNSIHFHNKAHGGSGYFNGTIDNISVKEVTSDPITVSFKEDVRGWVSFKSFVLESGVSTASDYYTMLSGKLYKHHIENTNRNNFYGVDYNSSVNVILNDGPGSVKSFHTLGYEGSQSRVEGIKFMTIESVLPQSGPLVGSPSAPEGKYAWDFDINLFGEIVGNTQWSPDYIVNNIKVYRNNILIYNGAIRAFNNTNGIHLRRDNPGDSGNAGDFQVGDIITTQLQEDSVDHFNSTPTDGWYVSNIETDKQEGSIHEFTEKEGKWFNYIKGVDSDISAETDFGAFDIQGIGILKEIINNTMEFDNPINASLQIGDIIYYQQNINSLGGFSTVNPNDIVKFGQVTGITSNTITIAESPGGAPDPDHGGFIFFAKNHAINTSSLLGYFADVKFENNSTDKIELFSVGSEITESSK